MATILSACCTSPGAFRNVPRSQPHAVLIADEIDYPFTPFTRATETMVLSINGKPVEHPDRRNRFRIPPGATVIQPDLERPSTSERWGPFKPMEFTAVAGRKYILFPPAKLGAMSLTEYTPGVERGKEVAWSGAGLRGR